MEKILSGLFMFLASMFFRAFVLLTYWNWFIIGTFKAPELNIVQMMGLSVFISLVKGIDSDDVEEKDRDLLRLFLISLFYHGLALFLGWIFSLFLN